MKYYIWECIRKFIECGLQDYLFRCEGFPNQCVFSMMLKTKHIWKSYSQLGCMCCFLPRTATAVGAELRLKVGPGACSRSPMWEVGGPSTWSFCCFSWAPEQGAGSWMESPGHRRMPMKRADATGGGFTRHATVLRFIVIFYGLLTYLILSQFRKWSNLCQGQ